MILLIALGSLAMISAVTGGFIHGFDLSFDFSDAIDAACRDLARESSGAERIR